MVKSNSTLLVLAGFMAFAGCQQPSQVVDQLPAANFNGPLVEAPHQAALEVPKVAVSLPKPEPKKVTPPVLAGIPREWVPAAKTNDWKWVVIHHSATTTGGAKAFDRMHKEKGWDELGYHFVIGNGTDTGDGQVEVGPRWPKQKWGAHAKTPDNRFNNYGIGICLVGNFDNDRPTRAQLQSLAKLVGYLEKTYHISSDNVIGHRDTKSTDCPGRNINIADIRRMAAQYAGLPESGDVVAQTARGELLTDDK